MAACPACGKELPGQFPFCPYCTAPLDDRGREQRKTVTVVFCDVAGSTSLGESTDPEALRALLARYFDRMRGIVESHGGTVEKFIGDAVMAVFGVPVAHEDDALRAVRAAAEMREAVPALGIQVRIGVNTGEVVTGTTERLATGDAVNVAARLEQAARPGEALLGAETMRLVGGAAETEQVEPLELKGKLERVPAFRLLRVGEAPERIHGDVFVGRERELDQIAAAWVRAGAEQRCELVTIVAEAGVGKTRLVAEALARFEAAVVRGRCLSYGEGITYWPVIEVVKQLGVLPSHPAASAALRSLLGETEVGTSAEEIAWAFRKLLEEQAPLVCVFEDIHWGEETFLDLIEHVALLSAGAPLLLLCTARPELVQRRPAWPVTLGLPPLSEGDVAKLVPDSITGELREKVVRASGGNPLFITEMVAMAGEVDGDVSVPPTLRALLAARLDQLESAERSVLERGAVEGEVFHRGAVQALASEATHVTPQLAALVRKELIRPDRPQLADDDGFRFRHVLIRDAAYEALPKATRAQLHERFAAWLEHHGADLVQLDEIVGYHLEQACRYRAELGLPDDEGLRAAASRRLTDAGHRARQRTDHRAAVSLFERAVALVPAGELDLRLETELADALFWAGRGIDALRRADALAERAEAAGDRVGALCARVKGGVFRITLEPEGATEELAALVGQALPVFEAAGGDVALYVGYSALGWVAYMGSQMDRALEAYELAAAYAQQSGLTNQFLGWRASVRYYGTTRTSELLAWHDEIEPRAGPDYWLRANRGRGFAMLGRFDEARTIVADARAAMAERGGGIQLGWITAFHSVDVELLAGDTAAAAEFGAGGFRMLDELGEHGFLPSVAARQARALYALDRLEEADVWADRAAELATDEVWAQMLWRQARATVQARRGEHARAELLAREAVAIGDETDFLNGQGDAYSDLAAVLLLVGKTDEAALALEQALERYDRKENVVMAERMRRRFEELGG